MLSVAITISLQLEISSCAIEQSFAQPDESNGKAASYRPITSSPRLVPDRSSEQWKHYDSEFHQALISNCVSATLMDAHAATFDRYFRYQMVTFQFRDDAPIRQHKDLLDCALKFSFIAEHRGIWPADWLCEALGVSRGGSYAWLTRPRSERSRSDEELGAKVRASLLASDRTYGARRVWRDLLAEGVSCGLHRIEQLMRLQVLKARPPLLRCPVTRRYCRTELHFGLAD